MKVRQMRLRWFGHVKESKQLSCENDEVEVEGCTSTERPRKTSCVRQDMERLGTGED